MIKLRNVPARLKFLATGKASWEDCQTGEVTYTRERWATRWALAGPQSYTWWWVERYGQLSCGCTRNPLTRRVVLIDLDCGAHSGGAL